MGFKIKLLFVLCVSWFLFTSEKIKFSHLTIKDGLSQSSVKCLMQDSRGFLWVGTSDGLNRYDGYQFEIISSSPTNPFSISGNDISCIYENPFDSTVWVGTQSTGLNRYNRESNTFSHFTNINSPTNHITDLLATNDSTLWIATRTGSLYYYVPEDSSFRRPKFSGEARFRAINSLEKDEDGNLWMATPSELYKWNYDKKERDRLPKKIRFPDIEENLSITSLKFDIKGNLWIGTLRNGLFRYHPKSKTVFRCRPGSDENMLKTVRVYDILARKNGEIWVATANGVCKFQPKTKSFEVFRNEPNDPETINNNTVYSLLEDQSGIVWVGTYLGGLNKIDPKQSRFPKFNNFSDFNNGNISTNDIRSISVDGSNTIWLGTSAGLVEMKNGNSISNTAGQNIKIHFKDINFTAIVSTPEGLIASKDGGIFLMTKRNRIISLSAQIQKQNNVLTKRFSSAIIDELDQVWMATGQGLIKFIPSENKFEFYNPEGPEGEPISFYPISIREDQTGKLWLGTLYGNLYVFDKYSNKFELVIANNNNRAQRSFTRIFSLCTSIPNEVWIGTNMGLYKLNPVTGDLIRYLKSDGLPNNVIYGVLADNSGDIWCSTNMGVSRLDRKTGKFQNYTYQDGLQSNEFNQNAFFKDPEGKIYFGGIDGLNIFDPAKIIPNSYIPQVAITGMEIQYKKVNPQSHPKITGKQISEIKKLTLNHKQNTFSFEFTALSFSLPERNQYKYSLTKAGEDDKWVNAGTRRIATYTNVPPGAYVFKVKGSNSDGVFNENATTIQIFITPPYWQTWWFYMLLLFFVTGIIFLIIYYRTRRIARKKIILKKLVVEKTRILSKQKEQIEKQNVELKIINENITLKSKKIAQKNKQLSEQHKQLSKQRDSLLQLAGKLNEVNQIKFRFFTNISHELRTPLTLVISPLKELIENVGELNKKETLRKLNNIYNNASKLLLIVNQLLDFRKTETDNMKLRVSEFELVPFVQKSAYSFNDLAARKKIDFSFGSTVTNLKIWADRDMLGKTIANLLSNAFKATQPEGAIRILITETVEQGKRFAEISIKDNGIGIEESKIPLIFERFYQLEDPANLHHSGSGLGLALVQKYVELHKGSVTVESMRGKGSEFKIKLPTGRAHFGEVVSYDEQKTENKNLLIASITEYLPASTEKPELANGTKKPTLLLIEDDSDLRAYMREMLSEAYNVEESGNAKTGTKKAKLKIPDLIICDVMLPDSSGFLVCEKLKAEFKTSHIPIILLTSLADKESRMNGIKAGADAYITKPFDLQHLLLVAENLIEGRRRLHKRFSLSSQGNIAEAVTNNSDRVFIKNAIKQIELNISNPDFHVEQFCSLLKLSQPQCYRKIKAITGFNISEFIRNTRLKKAAHLLKTGEFKISEVAYKTGFNDPNYFTKSFTRLFEMTPSEYAKS